MNRKSVYFQDQMRKIQDSIEAANIRRKEYDEKEYQERIDKLIYKQSKIKFFRNKSESMLKEKSEQTKERLEKFMEKKKMVEEEEQ